MPTRRHLALLLVLASTLTACAGSTQLSSSSGRVSVVASFYPLAFVAERVGGDRVDVTNLTPAGGEPHDLELGPQQVAEVAEADLVVYERGFQPAVDEAVTQNAPQATLDVTEAAPLRGDDPHLWLDPVLLARVATAVGDEMAAADSRHASDYRQRARALAGDLRALDRDFRHGLQTCRSRIVVTTHDAFGYLTERYGLQQEPISGLTPEVEPSPRRLAEVARLVEDRGVSTIFFETLVSPRTAKALAGDVGASTDVLNPLEGLAEPGEENYLSVMRDNLAALRKGLGCS